LSTLVTGGNAPTFGVGIGLVGAFMDQQQFSQLIDLFKRAEALPPLPETALRLIEVIDGGEPSLHELEQIVSVDPALAANIIRAASNAAYATQGWHVTTVTGAIMRLGVRNVRTLALTFTLHSVFGRATRSQYFDPGQFARHSVFVAAMGEFLYVRAASEGQAGGTWSPQEMFCAGLLHDLPKCLLAHVASDIYDSVWERARDAKQSFEEAFEGEFGEPLPLLGCAAVVAWRLPETFARAMAFIAEAPEDDQFSLEHDCLVTADGLAPAVGYGHEEWEVEPSSVDLRPSLLFVQQEMDGALKLVSEHCDVYTIGA
jgi:HD-like signal output (HDOD) protein